MIIYYFSFLDMLNRRKSATYEASDENTAYDKLYAEHEDAWNISVTT